MHLRRKNGRDKFDQNCSYERSQISVLVRVSIDIARAFNIVEHHQIDLHWPSVSCRAQGRNFEQIMCWQPRGGERTSPIDLRSYRAILLARRSGAARHARICSIARSVR